MRIILMIISSLLTATLLAQKPHQVVDVIPEQGIPHHQLTWTSQNSAPVYVPSDIQSFVAQKLGYGNDINLKLSHKISSQTLEHYHFNIYFKNIRVFGVEVHVAVLPDHRIKLIQSPDMIFSNISGSMPGKGEAELAQNMIGAEHLIQSETVLIPDGDRLKAVTYAELEGPETIHQEVLVDNGEVIYLNDLHKHYSASGPGDTTVNVRVFDPDPLTTAQVSYGGKYTDNGDQNSGSLNTERQQRTTTFTFKNGIISPENDFVKITEFSAPITAQTAKSSPDFNYTRDKDEFEDVNVVYHITHFRKHIQKLGYPNLPNYQIHVDAHALSNSDQSFFSTSVFPYRLYFGEGGVDDAEDADVILHEFSHAVIYAAAPTGSKDTERKCIEEALCDYFAASYSRQVSTFGANDVFNWDGHNEFWPGRSVNTSKSYAQASFKNGNYYAHTDLMSSSLNELYRRMGRDNADQLVLEACHFLTSSTEMPDFGKYMLISDSLLNGASNIRAISESFYIHGILNKVIDLPEVFSSGPEPIEIRSSANFTDQGSVLINASEGLDQIAIYDINGRLLWEKKFNGEKDTEIRGSLFKKGTYVITIADRNGNNLNERLLRY